MMIRPTIQMMAHARKVGRRVGSNAGQAWLLGTLSCWDLRHFRDEMLDGLVEVGIPREHKRRKYVVTLLDVAEASMRQRMAVRRHRMFERWKR